MRVLNFSKEEKTVILFLTVTALAGLGIDFLTKSFPSVKMVTALNRDLGKIDLNKTDKDTLKSVRGVGERLARRIIDYRLEKGGFNGLEELKSIKGITGNKYEKIKDNFVIR
ncbi:MAG: ComEA family DNA-binding protein [Deltaproteobacteria bacterium]